MITECGDHLLQGRHGEYIEQRGDRGDRGCRRERRHVVSLLKVAQGDADDRTDLGVTSKVQAVNRREDRRLADLEKGSTRGLGGGTRGWCHGHSPGANVDGVGPTTRRGRTDAATIDVVDCGEDGDASGADDART